MYGSTYIRDVFSQNLKALMKDKVSVTELSRDLDLNRTQINRYLTGESAPRPEILSRICDYFKVDARILTVALEDLAAEQEKNTDVMMTSVADCLIPVPLEILPNGLFEEWKLCEDGTGDFYRSFVSVSFVDGLRRIIRSIPAQSRDWDPSHGQSIRKKYYGQAIVQPGGFNVIEHKKDGINLRYKSFRHGYDGDETIFPGIELSSAPLGLRRRKKFIPLVLRHLACGKNNLRAVPRGFGQIQAKDAPFIVRRAVKDIEYEEQTFV